MAPIARVMAPPVTVLMLRDGNRRIAHDYWFENGVRVRYVGMNGVPVIIPIELLDFPATVAVNRQRGVEFMVRSAY